MTGVRPCARPCAGFATVKAGPGVIAAVPVGYADSVSLESTTGGTVQTTGPGTVRGLPDGHGARAPGHGRAPSGAPDRSAERPGGQGGGTRGPARGQWGAPTRPR